jgi:sulfite exporter TauE/SafE
MNIDFYSAFIIGLLGSGHCIGMCGGITSMLTSALHARSTEKKLNCGNLLTPNKNSINTPSYSKFTLSLFYNIGRISSYAIIGAIVGFSGSLAAKNIGVPLAGLRLVAGLFLVFLGLYLGQWLMWLGHIEQLGKGLWSKISPLTKKVIPVNTPIKALSLGGIWGWLPCGLVYSTLTWSLASGDALSGAGIMFFFGLGTLPALLTLSMSFEVINKILKNVIFRKLMALLIIIYGLYTVSLAYALLF